MAQTTACNRLHSIEERCARWLLLTADRMDFDTFRLTQEFLATMLSVRRAGVNEVAMTLHNAGLIVYKLGKITILDRSGLKKVTCECYTIVHQLLNH
jgi:CRP-like cAMP-binding protein